MSKKSNGTSTVDSGIGECEFIIKGSSRHVQHNPQCVNPLNPYKKAIAALTKKPAKNKSDDDFEEICRLEWEASLYLQDGRVVVPGEVIEGALVEAGRKSRDGPNVRAGVWSMGHWRLDFPGNDRTIEELRRDPRHIHVCRVGINGTKSIMRTRAVFPDWGLTFRVWHLKEIFSATDVHGLVDTLGRIVGLSDDRAIRGGRFEIVSWSSIG